MVGPRSFSFGSRYGLTRIRANSVSEPLAVKPAATILPLDVSATNASTPARFPACQLTVTAH
jgi:hypothetical protein